ncbi:ABC transporter permease subunit [bacterium]|nr:ABC transporter permease subunit [candidate division CSSED10-310 bacterium]
MSSAETRRYFRAFRRRRSAYGSLILFGLIFCIGMAAELIANNKPYFMMYRGKFYFPMIRTYHPAEFGVRDRIVMDYKTFQYRASDRVVILFPPIRWSPYEINKNVPRFPAPPSRLNPLGTDDRGRDVLTRIIYGFRVSMLYATCVWILSYILGILFGSVQGYAGGRLDFIGQRIIEIYTAVPYFFLLIILIAIFQPTIWLLIVLSSLFGWVGISYYIRAEFLRLRKFEFVEACRALGMKPGKIIFRQILPNALNPVITFSPFAVAGGIMGLAGLDFLGFGVPPPTASWGELLNQGKRHFTTAWWLATFPSAALFITLSLLNLIGEGVRYAFDPKKY